MNPGAETDEELIRQCIGQNRLAQKAMYEKYKRALFTKALRMVNNNEYAHDVLQESFIEIFHDMKDFKGGAGGIFSWMKTIVYRNGLRHLKIENRFTELVAARHDTEISWQDSLTADDLDAAIRTLPDGYRAVFLLAEVDGYKHREIAEMLGIAEGTSKSQLYQAKKLLQQKLKELKP